MTRTVILGPDWGSSTPEVVRVSPDDFDPLLGCCEPEEGEADPRYAVGLRLEIDNPSSVGEMCYESIGLDAWGSPSAPPEGK